MSMRQRLVILFSPLLRFLGQQNWIRWGIRFRFSTLFKGIDREFVVPFFGKKYRGNFKSFVDRSVYFWGAHEREALLTMGRCISKEDIVLDIGGNVGHHSLYFSTRAKEVHAFEPFPPVAEMFRERMRENNITNVHLHPFGVGDKNEEAVFYAPHGDNLGIGSFVQTNNVKNPEFGKLSVVNGDDMVEKLKLPRVDFIKIDAERYEKNILIGLQHTLRKFKPIVEIEYTPKEFGSEEELRTLVPDYDIKMIIVNRPFLFFFNRPTGKLAPFKFDEPRAELLLFPRT